MIKDGKILAAKSGREIFLNPSMANRHGLIAGATGTGKTVTMKVLAEGFSDLGVPVFFSDVKGDLTGMCRPGENSENVSGRVEKLGLENFDFKSYPTRFWDIFGEKGHPVRVTVSDMGPTLLSRLFGLNDVQQGVMNVVFRAADDNGLLLTDIKDLRAMLNYVNNNRAEFSSLYGNVSAASVGAIQRALLSFEQEGGSCVFGEPALDIGDWIRTDASGRGYINILESYRLIQSPLVYSTFLLWLLTALFEKLPEVGDMEKPRMVFFFDEAHLLFSGASSALVSKILQVVRLIRSKGVGVYFVTQSPSDIPGDVLAQLSNRLQHALRAYTPTEIKAVKATAQAFRENPEFDTAEAISSLGVGEALVSFLDEEGIPEVVEKAKILPPQSLMGAADEGTVNKIIASDEFELKYRSAVDRESAYEVLARAEQQLAEEQQKELEEKQKALEEKKAAAAAAKAEAAAAKASAKSSSKSSGKTGSSVASKAAKAAETTVINAVGRNIVNGLTGGKTTSASTIAKRAATNALNSALRNGSKSLVRGIADILK